MTYRENISNEEVNTLPLITFEGIITIVDTENQEEAAQYLSQQKIIGFDTESRAVFKKGVKDTISLVQLSGPDRSFLIRVNKVPLSSGVISVLQSRRITKVGLAIRDDLMRMKEVNRFHPNKFIDLQSIVGNFGIREMSLKKITAIVMGYRISKAQRLSNWNAVSLTEAQQRYAATDAWICREIYNKLMQDE